METSISLGDQQVRFDRDATMALYRSTITEPGSDSCGCTYCKNFARQRQGVYSDEFKLLLDRLGIDHHKEWEVFELGPSGAEPLTIKYGGWFLFCGELTKGPDTHPEAPFSFCFTTSFPTGTLPQHHPLCAIEFIAEARWILPEQYE